MLKNKLCFGNWKLHKTPSEVQGFIKEFEALCSDDEYKHFAIFPSDLTAYIFEGAKIKWGGQNICTQTSGAFTGESSAQTLKSMGASYALVGHSERRSLFHEKNEDLNLKTHVLLEQGLTPVFCIGESLQERESGKTFNVLKTQIEVGLKDIKFKNIIIAYEPVWAIGTGKAATPEIVEEVHNYLREFTNEPELSLLYGGSVKSDNAKEIFKIKNVDGFLIGGASLKPESFYDIFSKMKVL